ncbi:MAG: type II secretion system F family protein [Planctomycetota bacterium]|nr:type II secretion system F family protein [Planctomycetota bacterium]
MTGSIIATTEREAVHMLAGQTLFPLSLSTDKAATIRTSRKRVKGQVMATVYSQLSSLLRSGVPLLRSIAVLRKQASNPTLAHCLGEIHSQIEDGITLADAMMSFPKVFNEVAVNMARAGAEGGFLEDALERVAKFTEQQEDLKSETIGQLAYPLFLGTVGSLIVSGLVIFFVPKFGEMFDNLRERGELPFLTDWLLNFSASLRGPWALVAGFAIAALLILAYNYLQTDTGKRRRDLIKIRLPLVGNIFQAFAVARFCRVLGTMLRNGVPIIKSLQISREAAGNRVLSESIDIATENITTGQSLSEPLGRSGYFPPTVVEMIAVAEESNTLDDVLIDIADSLEARTSRRLTLAVRLLEPIMLLVMAGAVLVVVIALLLPVIKMSSAI